LAPDRGSIMADPNRTRGADPYKAVNLRAANMPSMAVYRGGAEASTWFPSHESVGARTAQLRLEAFVHSPWFIPHDQWLQIMRSAIVVFRIMAGTSRLRHEDLSPKTFYGLVDKYTGGGKAYIPVGAAAKAYP
jgi:hypothetical protein